LLRVNTPLHRVHKGTTQILKVSVIEARQETLDPLRCDPFAGWLEKPSDSF
jgi:hypothetical protein